MSKSIYINLAVKDVAAAREFYKKLGFDLNEQFSSDQNAIMMVNDQIMLMLITKDLFKQNILREVADTKTTREVGLAIQVENREEVDKTLKAALAAGGKEEGEIMDDKEIGMYSRGFSDLDGHRLDILCMTT